MTTEFWEERWNNNDTGWDLGQVSPPLKAYFDQLENKSLKILIPGAGNAYEAEYLWRNGFENTHIVEIAKSAIDAFKKRYSGFPDDQIIHADFFDLNQAFDLIIEQTFFCAIDPSVRKEYVKKMRNLLSPEGHLVGVMFNRSFVGGPPFGGSVEEYRGLFEPDFSIQIMEECYNSIPPRQGSEIFIKLQTK